MSDQDKVKHALRLAARFGSVRGGLRKAWVIDQMVRVLCGCIFEGHDYGIQFRGECDEYRAWVASRDKWDTGVSP